MKSVNFTFLLLLFFFIGNSQQTVLMSENDILKVAQSYHIEKDFFENGKIQGQYSYLQFKSKQFLIEMINDPRRPHLFHSELSQFKKEIIRTGVNSATEFYNKMKNYKLLYKVWVKDDPLFTKIVEDQLKDNKEYYICIDTDGAFTFVLKEDKHLNEALLARASIVSYPSSKN